MFLQLGVDGGFCGPLFSLDSVFGVRIQSNVIMLPRNAQKTTPQVETAPDHAHDVREMKIILLCEEILC